MKQLDKLEFDKGGVVMASGISFLEILVNEVTMVIGALIFLFCGALLIFKRKSLNRLQKGLAVTALIVTGIYWAFMIWLAIMWGQQLPRPMP